MKGIFVSWFYHENICKYWGAVCTLAHPLFVNKLWSFKTNVLVVVNSKTPWLLLLLPRAATRGVL